MTFADEAGTFVDQTEGVRSSERTRFPSAERERTPEVSFIGESRLATQTTVPLEKLNQIPTYLRVDFPGLKKPRVYLPPVETSTEPSSFRVWFTAMVFDEEVEEAKAQRKRRI